MELLPGGSVRIQVLSKSELRHAKNAPYECTSRLCRAADHDMRMSNVW